jgi:hypothetical protein
MRKLGTTLSMTAAFIAAMLAVYYIHVRYLTVDVVFYSALFDAALAAFIVGTCLFAMSRLPLGTFEKSLLVIIWLLGGYAFAISAPTVLDRSLSFYILEKLQQRGGGIEVARFSDVFRNEYMEEARLVDVRLTEQLQSGTITIENGCVKLTKRGDWLASTSRFFRLHLLPRRRLLAGEYTDVLVDPFAESHSGPMGYECK